MEESGKKTARVLLNAALVTEVVLVKAQDQQKKTRHRLTEVLNALGVNAEAIRQALATHLKVPEISLQDHNMDSDLVDLIPESWAVKHGIIPLERVQNILTLGMVNPFDIEVVKDIRFKTGLNVRVAVISEAELPGVIESCYGTGTSLQPSEIDLDQVLSNIGTEEIEILAHSQQEEEEEDEFPDGMESEAPVIRLLDRIIQDAVRARATDVHIEPAQSRVLVRYRIDGVLRDILNVPKYVQGPLLSRVKVMGSMDISDKRRPQDGRSKIKIGKRVVDLRISSLPTMYGEKIVLRLLEQKKGAISIEGIGFPPPSRSGHRPANTASTGDDIMHRSHGEREDYNTLFDPCTSQRRDD